MSWLSGIAAAALLCLGAGNAAAQTQTQTFDLVPGWNAIFVEVLPDDNRTAAVFAAVPIESVWSWNPKLSPADYIEDPSEAATMWNQDLWLRYFAAGEQALLNNLFAVHANHAYLVKLGGSQPATLSVTGRPALRRIAWVADAFNFVGFPVDATLPPLFGTFFDFAPAHTAEQTFALLPSGVWEPVQTPGGPDREVRSGEAYWVFSNGVSDFNAPLEVSVESGDGLDYDIFLEQIEVRVENRTNVDLPLSVENELSGGALAYEKFDATVRGGFVWAELGATETFPMLAPGEERVLRIGVRRALFPSERIETVLHFSDGVGTRWSAPLEAGPAPTTTTNGLTSETSNEVPVAAVAGLPPSGLWIGTATINRVAEVNPPTADLSFDLDLRLVGTGPGTPAQRDLCEGGANDSQTCTTSIDSECAGYDVAIACGTNNLCNGGPDVDQSCETNADCGGGGAAVDCGTDDLCNNGPDNGQACSTNTDCGSGGQPVAACVAQLDPTFLTGGEGFGAGRIGSTWLYHDRGEDLHATNWKLAGGILESEWAQGTGEFGFGDPDQDGDGFADDATLLASTCGGNCPFGAAERPPTYYFRTRFDVPLAAEWTTPPSNIEINLLADDGAVVWLNGTEIGRVNMPSGTPAFDTSAELPLAGDEESQQTLISVPVTHLNFGADNVLAVEVHQHESESTHQQLVCDAGAGDLEGLNCTTDSDCTGGGCVATAIAPEAPTTPTIFPSGGSQAELRLIVHVDANNQVRLLKQVIQLRSGTDYVLLTDDSLIPSFAPVAYRDDAGVGRRLSAPAFDFADAEAGCPGCLKLDPTSGDVSVKGTAILPATHPTNPFYHRFHPDHDNLDADFEVVGLCSGGGDDSNACSANGECSGFDVTHACVNSLCSDGANAGELCAAESDCPTATCFLPDIESYTIERDIELEFTSFDQTGDELAERGLGWGSSEAGGIYRETLKGLHKEPIQVEGSFRLFRPPSSKIETLNPAPPAPVN